MTDTAGVVHARYDYDPYGRITKLSGDLEADLGFTGFYKHQASGLNLTLYRAYNADLGRWLSRDPIGENGGIDLYAYVGNSPLRWVDTLGLDGGPLPGVPSPPPNIPGGPWTWSPNPQNGRQGDFIGPKQPSGPRERLTYAPPGPNNPDPYWKKTDTTGNQQRYDDPNGKPISPDEAHPGPEPWWEKLFVLPEEILIIPPMFIPPGFLPPKNKCPSDPTHDPYLA